MAQFSQLRNLSCLTVQFYNKLKLNNLQELVKSEHLTELTLKVEVTQEEFLFLFNVYHKGIRSSLKKLVLFELASV